MPARKYESIPCSKCGGVRKRSPKGHVYCTECNKRHREDNRVRNRTRDKNYYQNHKEQAKQTMLVYRKNNKEKIKLYLQSDEKKNKLKEWRTLGNSGSRHPDYSVWLSMKNRCYNENNHKYRSHGGRGITVCDRWLESFNNFLSDMGARPEPRGLYSIDRYPNNNGNYEPGNCRWATAKEQANNTRRNLSYKLSIVDNSPIYYPFGKMITLSEFSEQTGIPLIICKYRYAQNWSADWILDDEWNSRFYYHEDKKYTLVELGLISGVPYSKINWRLKNGWSLKEAMRKR